MSLSIGIGLGPTFGGKAVPADFHIALSAYAGSIDQDSTDTTTVTATLGAAAEQTLTLSVSGYPTGASGTFNNATISSDGGSSVLTHDIGPDVEPGTYSIRISATGLVQTKSRTFTLTVAEVVTPSDWLLSTSDWNDSGVWDDSAVWID